MKHSVCKLLALLLLAASPALADPLNPSDPDYINPFADNRREGERLSERFARDWYEQRVLEDTAATREAAEETLKIEKQERGERFDAEWEAQNHARRQPTDERQ